MVPEKGIIMHNTTSKIDLQFLLYYGIM